MTKKNESFIPIDFECYDVKTANILVVGATGSGKTTFIEGLKDPAHLQQESIYSSTQTANTRSLVCRIASDFWSIVVIDTPGFGDNSAIQKTDLELENLILDFVKKDVTSLNQVLIAIPLGRRLESTQVRTLMNVLDFLGTGMRPCSSILFTFAENKSEQERHRHIKEFKRHPDLKDIYKFCQKKYFFTGTCSHPIAIEKQHQIRAQKLNQSRIVQAAITSQPAALRGERYDAVSSRFQVFESAAKDSLVLKKVLPQLEPRARDVEGLRFRLAELATKGRKEAQYNNLVEKYADISSQHLHQQCAEWYKLQNAVEAYTRQGGELQDVAQTITSYFNELVHADIELTRACRRVTLDSESDSEDEDSETLEAERQVQPSSKPTWSWTKVGLVKEEEKQSDLETPPTPSQDTPSQVQPDQPEQASQEDLKPTYSSVCDSCSEQCNQRE